MKEFAGMKKCSREKWLSQLYSAHSPQERAEVYDHWGLQYETDVLTTGYNMPQIFTGLTCRYVSSLILPILDVGAGTGILGQSLSLLGYTTIEALDYSHGMLDVCRAKRVYSNYHQMDINSPIALPDSQYSAVLVMGLFGKGHASPATLHELTRITRPGGLLLFSIRDDEYISGGYKEIQDNLVSSGNWKARYCSEPFNSVPFDTTPILNLILGFEVL